MSFKSGDKRNVRILGSRYLNDISREQDGATVVTKRFWNEGISTAGENIGFIAAESLRGTVATVTFQAKGDKYERRNADGSVTEGEVRGDRWSFSVAAPTSDLKALKDDMATLKELGL